MTGNSILLIGGSGVVGLQTAQFLRAAHPGVPLLIGGRDQVKGRTVAAAIGNAESVVIDLQAQDLGLGASAVSAISAVAIFFKDDGLAGLRFAQSRGLPHISISSGIHEIGPEVASYMHKPDIAPVVLGAEWLVGATTVPTLALAREFGKVRDISIGALIDEQDTGGPEAKVDMARLTKTMSAALTRRNGDFYWRTGVEAEAEFFAADGTRMEASAFAPYDVVALAAATGAPNVQFNLAMGMSSTRRQGGPVSTEVLIELAGADHAGRSLRTRHAVVHPQGQMPLTGLGVAMILERLVGLDGKAATPAGLYFPYQLLESARYLDRLKTIGATILTLDVL